MRDVNPPQTTMGRDPPQPFNTPNPTRTRQTINTITDFFRTRIPIEPADFVRESADIPVPHAQQTKAPPHCPALIPIQVIMEHPDLPVLRDPPREANTLRVSAEQVAPLNPQARQNQAQT